MSGRRNNGTPRGKHSRGKQTKHSSPPEPAPDPSPPLELTAAAAKQVEGLSGYDLTKGLHDHAKELFHKGDVGAFSSEDVNEALKMTAAFQCPEYTPRGTSIMFIPYLADRKIMELPRSKRGRAQFDCTLMAEDFGAKMMELADTTLNKPMENAMLLLEALNNTTLIKKPYDDIQGLEQLVALGGSAREVLMVSFLIKGLVPEGLDFVTVRPSPVHGDGVFAKRNIKRGSLVTMYPCDAFSYTTKGEQTLWAKSNGDPMLRCEAELLFGYSAQIEPTNIAIAGDPDKYSNASCGHLINDGAFLLTKDCNVDEVLKYAKASAEAQNCHFIPLAGIVLAVVASRDIKKGDEVFATYGAGFWVRFGL